MNEKRADVSPDAKVVVADILYQSFPTGVIEPTEAVPEPTFATAPNVPFCISNQILQPLVDAEFVTLNLAHCITELLLTNTEAATVAPEDTAALADRVKIAVPAEPSVNKSAVKVPSGAILLLAVTVMSVFTQAALSNCSL